VSGASGGTSEPDLAALHRDYRAFLDVQAQAYVDVRDALDAAADVVRVIRAQLEQGRNIRDLGAFIDPKPLRAALAVGFDQFERTRRVGQRMLFRVLLAEGATVADICRAWDMAPDAVAAILDEAD
jgi:hypothetical protein